MCHGEKVVGHHWYIIGYLQNQEKKELVILHTDSWLSWKVLEIQILAMNLVISLLQHKHFPREIRNTPNEKLLTTFWK